MGRESKAELNHDVSERRPSGLGHGLAVVAPARVEDLMARDFVSLPAWFPAEKAVQILRQTGKSFVLVGGPGGQRLATVRELAAAPPERSVAGCGSALGPGVSVDAGLDEALALMNLHGLDRVAVTVSRLLVGVVTRDAALQHVHATPGARTHLLAA